MERKVVVSGMGIVSPLGIGKDEFWRNLIKGKSATKRMDQVEDKRAGYPLNLKRIKAKVGAPVLGFNPLDFMSRKEAKRLSRAAQFAIAATSMALKDAGIKIGEEDSKRIGVITGSAVGDIKTLLKEAKKGPTKVSPFLLPKLMPNLPSSAISIHFGIKNLSLATVSACASSTHAIALGFDFIKNNRLEIAVVGGSDSILNPLVFAGLSNAKAISRRNDEPEKASRPFDKERDGFVPGEGAGILVLETLEYAQKRKKPLVELLGYGMSDDAYHITAPDPKGEGAKKAMEQAITKGDKILLNKIDYINAHGTSTPLNDKMETLAIKKVFGDRAYEIPISSTKSQIGHLMGAGGAVEAIATILAIENKFIPATINLETADPKCDLDYVLEPRKKEIRIALSNSFGFGGHNGTLCLGSFHCL